MYKKLWEKYGFEIILVGTILVIFILYLFRRGNKGTWSTSIYLPTKLGKNTYTAPNKKPDSRGETECRRVLENFFNKPFPKERPNFLRNPITSSFTEANNLELDCYNEELGLAVEYNGIQHYKFTAHFHKSKDAFHNQKYRDYVKRDLCQKNGVILIEVPYNVNVENIEKFLTDKLYYHGYNKWNQKKR
jgi:hypothetical protein